MDDSNLGTEHLHDLGDLSLSPKTLAWLGACAMLVCAALAGAAFTSGSDKGDRAAVQLAAESH